MTPEELARRIEQFVLDRIGLLAMEFEANEAGARERIRNATTAHEEVLAALDRDQDPSMEQMLNVLRGTRLLIDDRTSRAAYAEMQRFLLDLSAFLDVELGR